MTTRNQSLSRLYRCVECRTNFGAVVELEGGQETFVSLEADADVPEGWDGTYYRGVCPECAASYREEEMRACDPSGLLACVVALIAMAVLLVVIMIVVNR